MGLIKDIGAEIQAGKSVLIDKATKIQRTVEDMSIPPLVITGEGYLLYQKGKSVYNKIKDILKPQKEAYIGSDVSTKHKPVPAASEYTTDNPAYLQIGEIVFPLYSYSSPKATFTKVTDKLVDGSPVMELTTMDFPIIDVKTTIDMGSRRITDNCWRMPEGGIDPPRTESAQASNDMVEIIPFEQAINELNTGMPLPIKNKYFENHGWKWAIVTPIQYRFKEDGSNVVEMTMELTVVSDDAGILVQKPEGNSSISTTPVEE